MPEQAHLKSRNGWIPASAWPAIHASRPEESSLWEGAVSGYVSFRQSRGRIRWPSASRSANSCCAQIVGNAGTQVSAIAGLAGTAGTAKDTMTAVPVPAEPPADADALRDDIATNIVPAINNNLADMQAKVNAALRGLGIIAT